MLLVMVVMVIMEPLMDAQRQVLKVVWKPFYFSLFHALIPN